jgi:uncharacterized protein YdaU (DUF1376 family)
VVCGKKGKVMAKFCWMPLYTSDLVSSCVDMTPSQFGAYVRLLCYAWDNDGVPNDATACGRIAGGIDSQDWKAIRRRLEVLDAGTDRERLSHARLEAEREKQAHLHDSRSEAGRRAAKKRWQTQCDRNADALTKPCHLEPEPEPEPKIYLEPDKSPPAAQVDATSEPPKRRKRSQPASSVSWSADAGWHGITPEDRQEWAAAFPAAVIDQELAKATAWLKANPSKAGKRNWRAFVVRWLTRCQDHGGTNRQAGRKPEDYDRVANLERKAAQFSSLRPAPYRRPKEVEELAATLKLKDEDL